MCPAILLLLVFFYLIGGQFNDLRKDEENEMEVLLRAFNLMEAGPRFSIDFVYPLLNGKKTAGRSFATFFSLSVQFLC